MDGLKKKRQGLWWKIPAGLLFLLLVTLAVVILNLNPLVHSQINRALKKSLVAGGSLDGITIDLRSGQVDFSGLTLASPAGFAQKPFMTLDSLSVAVDPGSLLEDVLVVNHLKVNGLTLILERDQHGQSNLKALLPLDEASQHKQEPVSAADSPSVFPATLVRSLEIDNVSVMLIDRASGERWTAHFRIDLKIDDLTLGDLSTPEVMLGKVLFSLGDVNIDQPAGFGSDPLLSLKKLVIAADELTLVAPEYNISEISLQGADAAITVDKNGLTNLQALSDALFGRGEGKDTQKNETAAKPESSAGVPVITIGKINLADGSLLYRNEQKTADPLVLQMNTITADVTGLRLFDKHNIADPATAELSFKLAQPNDFPTAYFGALATVGPVGEGVPPLNAQLRLYGLKLDTLGARVPPSVRTALGASGLDIAMTLALDNDSVKLQADVLTDKNIRYTAIKVQGPLTSPRIDVGKFMVGFNRVSGWLDNAGQGGVNAGIDIAKTGANMTKGVGTGAYEIGKQLGQDFYEIGAGLVTVNGQRVNKGVAETTGGTVGRVNDLARGTGDTTTEGLKGSYGSLSGDASVNAWDDGIVMRYRGSMERARKLLTDMTYPPVTE